MCFDAAEEHTDENMESFANKLKVDESKLPTFMNTPDKYIDLVQKTNDPVLWCDLVRSIREYDVSGLTASEKGLIIRNLAEDVLTVHGIAKFIPGKYETDC